MANKQQVKYSVDKIPQSLRDLTRNSYLLSVHDLEEVCKSMFDDSIMNSLICDYPSFESVLMITNDNVSRSIAKVRNATAAAKKVVDRERIGS